MGDSMSRTCPACGDPGDPAAANMAPGGPFGPCRACGLPPMCFPAARPAPLAAWTDGSGTTQDKLAGIGVVLARGGAVVCEAGEAIGLGSNNVAEVRAIGRALTLARELHGGARDREAVTVYSDSQFAIDALTRPLNVRRNPVLVALLAGVRREVGRWRRLRFEHVEGHAGVEHNERADWLAGRARKAAVAAARAAGGAAA